MKKRNLGFLRFGIKYCSNFFIFYGMVFSYPFLQVLFSNLVCVSGMPYTDFYKEKSCYTGFRLVNSIFSGVILLISFVFEIIILYFFVDFEPFSNLPFAAFDNKLSLIKLIPRYFVPFASIWDFDVIYLILYSFFRGNSDLF